MNWREALEQPWRDGLDATAERLFSDPQTARSFATGYALTVLVAMGLVTPEQANEYADDTRASAIELERLLEPHEPETGQESG